MRTHDELILVVKRECLFPDATVHGMQMTDIQPFLTRIATHREFKPRNLMEQDPTYKQIIPYVIFHHGNSFFLMQRHAKASETRLRNKYTLGIGGHVREADMVGADIFSWARREFYEEVHYDGDLTLSPLGIVNDDTNDVGQVHAGLVLLARGTSNIISIRSELHAGKLVPLDTICQYRDHLESWSAFVLDALLTTPT